MESQGHLQGSGAWRFGVFSAVTALVVVVFALLLLSGLPLEVRRIISGLGLIGGGLTAAWSCRYRAVRSEGLRRRAWNLWALGCGSASLGNLSLLVYGGRLEGVSTSNIALWLTLALAVGGVMSFPVAKRRRTDLVRMLLDGVVIGGSVAAVAGAKVASLESVDPADAVGNLAAPVIDVVVATLATLLFTRGTPADRPTLGATAIGFGLYAVSDLLYALHVFEHNTFQLGSPADLGWLAGYALIAWAVRNPWTLSRAEETESVESSPVFGTAVVFVVFVAAGVVSLLNLEQTRDSTFSAVVWVGVLIAMLGRQFFLVLDNEHLRRTLEQRVEERTRSLRQVTRQSELLVNSVGDGIYGVDRHGLITFVNPAAAQSLGYEPRRLIGQDAHATFHAPAGPGTPFPSEHCYIVEAIRDGVMTNAEEDNYVRADGREIPVEVTATPLTDDGTTLGAVVVFRDVTQRREVDRLKSEFVSMVSHELRTPLTAIRGSLGLLAGGALGPLTPPATRMVDIALISSERLTRLINEILDLERMDAGALPMELGDHSARSLIDTAMGQASVLALEAGVSVRVLRAEGDVRADADRVVQTLLNLLGNAIKFSDPGLEVTVQAARRGSFVEFEVSDAGRGIPADKLDAVFARFQQVDSSDAREKGGSGLGLAISRSIVERLGGRIWAANNPGGGASFRFTLPVARGAGEPGASPAGPPDRTSSSRRGPGAPEPPSTAGPDAREEPALVRSAPGARSSR
jgi:PAS domain S-box-containing protein